MAKDYIDDRTREDRIYAYFEIVNAEDLNASKKIDEEFGKVWLRLVNYYNNCYLFCAL